ncbi:glycoside hydrolase family 48 protein [Actinomadura sp. HBU206391]|uniref:glycoside hydrolase family 48 protein n=1 Tax=Actinomadura sp. HBU206391 TaxID=2731692 RepID=UPI0016500E19|nr:glycoside hydrolase family 48 protein [Actinomadura sp. HBU206391]MBC6461131.1 cellulose binding domain-containing protein [Actinomadura sp. HBU206391]
MRRRHRWRRLTAFGAGVLLTLSSLVVSAGSAHAAVQCQVNYAKNDWGSGFTANITINNLGDPLTGWTLRYAYAGNQRLQNGWNGSWSQSGQNVTVTNAPYNGNLATGASATTSANFSYSGTNTDPTAFSVNNVACNGAAANTPPTVSISSPTAGQQFPVGSNVTVNATASDAAPGSVSTVEFFRDGLLVGSDTTAPYSFTHTALPAGNYTLQVRATDDQGATGTAQVAIVVNSGPTLVVSPASVSVPEGDTANYTVRLSAAPSANVTVASARTAGDTDITVSAGASRTFTTTNWNTAQTVTLAAAEDADQTAGQATVTVSATGYPSVPVTATEADNDAPPVSSYIDEFTTQYNKIKAPGNGYFSAEGVPYHSIETLLVEAPDHGHETTSEAFGFWLWLEAQYGRVSENWAPFNQAWNVMEQYIIPTAAGQPGGQASYNPGDPADYAPEFGQPSQYPVPLSTSVVAGQDPLASELQQAYGNRNMYSMHWLLDVDDVYGFGRNRTGAECGDNTQRVTYINTYQRGPQESVWETVPHPSCDTGRFGQSGGGGYPPLFIQGSTANQWRYTAAPDADARAVQAAYWALTWATEQGNQSQISATVTKAAKMGDYLRYAFYDKYFKNPGCTSPSCAAGSGKSSSAYLLNWYFAWGGDMSDAWSWRIGSSHNHGGYQNPLAAWALSPAGPAALRPRSSTAPADWQQSLTRQVQFYTWLQSAEGAIAGGATNSYGGAYGAPPSGTPTFFGMAYDVAPVYHDPPSNQWFGFQAWGMHRLAELYYVTGNTQAKAVLDKWVNWATTNTTLGTGSSFQIPNEMDWSGAPAASFSSATGTPGANPGLHVTIRNRTNDVGVAAAYARTLIYYAAKEGGSTLGTQAKNTAKGLLDRMLLLKESKGITVTETRADYNRFDDVWSSSNQQGLYIPSGYSGTMPNGDTIQPGSTFIGIRSFLRDDPEWPKVQSYLDGGAAPTFVIHRFWAQADIAMALADYGSLFPNG